MHSRTNWDIADTYYPALRLSMGESRMEFNDDELEAYVASILPGTNAENVENFMRSLQKFGRQVAPLAQRALPGMIQGAAQGGMVAGPWGALAGALGGGAASMLSGGGKAGGEKPSTQQAAPTQVPTTMAPSIAPSPTSMSGVGNMAPIQQLLGLLSRPETMQALSSLLMSQSGRHTVAVGARNVPAVAFANAIAEIAADVIEAASDVVTSDKVADYLIDSEGEMRGDVVNPSERARLLMIDIAGAASEEYFDDEDDGSLEDEGFMDDEDEYSEASFEGDVLAIYELAVRGRSY